MKRGYPKDPLDKCQWTIEYNKKITFMAMVIIKKKKVVGHKKMDEKYELRQLPTCIMQFLKYNPMKNNVEGICNVYL
jgi:hypothetical protein